MKSRETHINEEASVAKGTTFILQCRDNILEIVLSKCPGVVDLARLLLLLLPCRRLLLAIAGVLGGGRVLVPGVVLLLLGEEGE